VGGGALALSADPASARAALSPLADFSYDFHDLALTRVD